MQIDEALEKIKILRRTYSKIVESAINSNDPYELEDILRLIGHLQCSYDHLLATKAKGDEDFYCVVCKHLPACLILMGEIGTDTGPIYTILSILTNGKIQPCSACKTDKEGNETINKNSK